MDSRMTIGRLFNIRSSIASLDDRYQTIVRNVPHTELSSDVYIASYVVANAVAIYMTCRHGHELNIYSDGYKI